MPAQEAPVPQGRGPMGEGTALGLLEADTVWDPLENGSQQRVLSTEKSPHCHPEGAALRFKTMDE